MSNATTEWKSYDDNEENILQSPHVLLRLKRNICGKIVYVEIFADEGEAADRVASVSALDHFQQVEMIERFNKDWADLSYRFAS